MKINTIIYVLAIFLTLMSFELSAQKYIEVDDILYRVIKEADEASTYGTVSVASPEYGEYEGNVVIPNVIKESNDEYADVYKVVGIDDLAFYLANHLEFVSLPISLDTIGNNAFEKCNQLSTIQLPTSLKVLGERCFTECPISELKLPESLEEIGHSCFSRCQLTSITIPSAVKSIDDRAFSCETLTNVTVLGDTSSWEGWYVFGNNDNLQISVTHKLSNGKLLKDYGNKINQP